MSELKRDMDKKGFSRRKMLKSTAAGLLAGFACMALPRLSLKPAGATETGRKKVLTIYFSRTGNTREIAKKIHQIVGGDIIELQTVKPYPKEYDEVTKQAKEELSSGFMPPLKTKLDNISAYEVVFVGSPIWWGTAAPPVQTFLTSCNLAGKTIAPFVTHAGSGLGRSVEDVAKLCPGATVKDGLAVWGRDAKDARADVSAWLGKPGVNK